MQSRGRGGKKKKKKKNTPLTFSFGKLAHREESDVFQDVSLGAFFAGNALYQACLEFEVQRVVLREVKVEIMGGQRWAWGHAWGVTGDGGERRAKIKRQLE